MDRILDEEYSMQNLRNDKRFWGFMKTNNDFNTTVVVTIVASNSFEKIKAFFEVIFLKLKAKEIFYSCLQKMYNKFIDVLVTGNHVEMLGNLFEIDFTLWMHEDFNPKMENLPGLVKACMNNNYDIVKILVANGFLLR